MIYKPTIDVQSWKESLKKKTAYLSTLSINNWDSSPQIKYKHFMEYIK